MALPTSHHDLALSSPFSAWSPSNSWPRFCLQGEWKPATCAACPEALPGSCLLSSAPPPFKFWKNFRQLRGLDYLRPCKLVNIQLNHILLGWAKIARKGRKWDNTGWMARRWGVVKKTMANVEGEFMTAPILSSHTFSTPPLQLQISHCSGHNLKTWFYLLMNFSQSRLSFYHHMIFLLPMLPP